MERLREIREFVRSAHAGQMRAGGIQPYYNHLGRVAENVSHLPESYQVVAYCHDYLEDVRGATVEALRSIGITQIEIESIQNLTKSRGESFSDYMIRVQSSPISSVVKAADRADNLLERHPEWSREKVLSYCDEAVIILNQCSDEVVRGLLGRRLNMMVRLS